MLLSPPIHEGMLFKILASGCAVESVVQRVLGMQWDYWTVLEEEGRLHNHHSFIEIIEILHRNPPDVKVYTVAGRQRCSGRRWLVVKPIFMISPLYSCETRHFLTALGQLKLTEFFQERHTRARIVIGFLPEFHWKKNMHGRLADSRCYPSV